MAASVSAPAAAPTASASSAPAPIAPTGGSAPASAPSAPPAPADIHAIVADAVKSQVAPLTAENADLKQKLAAKEKETAETAVGKATAEEQVKALADRFNREKSKTAIQEASNRYAYATPTHKDMALQAFNAQAGQPIVKDSGDVFVMQGGKEVALHAAYDTFMQGPAGAIFKTSAAQPGPGQPPAASPNTQRKSFKDMTDEEFNALRRSGEVKGTLTNDRDAPVYQVKQPTSPYWEQRRQKEMAQFFPNGGSQPVNQPRR